MQHLPKQYRQFGEQIRATKKDVTLDREFIVVDVKPNAHHDDQAYENSAELRKLVPRGLCFVLEKVGASAPAPQLRHTLAGIHKFGYKENEYFAVAPPDDTTHLVFTEKANGECFHIAAFELNPTQCYIIFGSKNVHMLVRADHIQEDMQLYTEDRYGYARRMAMKFLELNVQRIDAIITTLVQSGETWVAECCTLDSPHIVEYKRDTMPFFAITRPPIAADGRVRTELTARGPDEASAMFTAHGVEKVKIHVSRTEVDQEEQRIFWENLDNSEGAVVYEITARGTVRQIYKLKSHEYTFWRAVREKMKGVCPSTVIQKRLRDLHVRPLNFDELQQDALEFNAWARAHWKINFGEFFVNWPARRAEFAKVPPETRRSLLKAFDQAGRAQATQVQLIADGQPGSLATQVQLIAVGLPGCGKTTVLRRVAEEFNGKYLDQDMCGCRPVAYHRDARRLSQDENLKLVAFGKNNHTQKIRAEFLSNIKAGQRVWVVWYHPDDIDPENPVARLAQLSVERATRRAEQDPKHPVKAGKVKMVVGGFRNNYEELDDDADNASIVPVDATLTVEEQVRALRENILQSFPHLKKPDVVKVPTPEERRELERFDALRTRVDRMNETLDLAKKPAAPHVNPVRGFVDFRVDPDRVGLFKLSMCDRIVDMLPMHDAIAKRGETVGVLAAQQIRDPLYWSVVLDADSTARLLTATPELGKMRRTKQLHVTLLFQGNRPHERRVELEKVEGKTVKFQTVNFAQDRKAAAWRVELPADVPCANEIPHITMATRGCSPVYSNEMLATETPVLVQTIELQGEITRHR
jgi:uridine kinase/2'-5' RNA ligase